MGNNIIRLDFLISIEIMAFLNGEGHLVVLNGQKSRGSNHPSKPHRPSFNKLFEPTGLYKGPQMIKMSLGMK